MGDDCRMLERSCQLEIRLACWQAMDRPTTSTSVPLREDTESLRRREADQVLPTTVNVDESLRRGMAEVGGEAAISQSGFMTPRSSPPGPMMQNNWLGGLEVPRWVSRLGNYLSIAQEQLAPSPLAGTSNPPAPTPPGGVSFALRSPPRIQRQLRAPTPPSSEVSAGAIQAEVQRQLGGILNRLRVAEDTNMHLRHELEAERERLRALRQVKDGGMRLPQSRRHLGQRESQGNTQEASMEA